MTANTTDWSIKLTMDDDVVTMNADARGAGMIPKKNNELLLTKTSAATITKAQEARESVLQ